MRQKICKKTNFRKCWGQLLGSIFIVTKIKVHILLFILYKFDRPCNKTHKNFNRSHLLKDCETLVPLVPSFRTNSDIIVIYYAKFKMAALHLFNTKIYLIYIKCSPWVSLDVCSQIFTYIYLPQNLFYLLNAFVSIWDFIEYLQFMQLYGKMFTFIRKQ